ncbi:MAG: M28 family peptidase [candidate division Zixibacteria bacterium]|nr:M28 family peptidase [candidate division Zixibacteria bacterium]
MTNSPKIIFALICAFLLITSASMGEDLYIVKNVEKDINELVSLEGVNVYGILQGELLVGATSAGLSALGNSALETEAIGLRHEDESYYLFQLNPEDVDNLPDGINLLYYNGKDAVAIIDKDLDHKYYSRLKRLTHISFVPKASVGKKHNIPSFDRVIDPEIQEIVDLVSETEYAAYIQRMQDFVTRYSYTDSCRAAEQWAIDVFDSFGYETELFPYSGSGGTWYDAIGRKIGTEYPDSIYIIIGHIDATSGDPYDNAPGAEDNASGTAAVLEAARVMSGYDFDCTIEFVCVSGEEQGLYGSEAYAEYCSNNDKNIGGVLNFDMISYEGGYGWDTNVYTDQYFAAEVALGDLLGDLTDEYSDAYSIRVQTDGPFYGSDHYYFSLYGYPAPFSIDAQLWGAPDWYPWYHSTQDLISHLDLDFGTEVVKGGVATLATLANLSIPPVLEFAYPNGLPELIDPDGGTSFRVDVTAGTNQPQPGTGMLHYSTGGNYNSVPMEVVAPNIYDAVFPALECGVVVDFYLSAETQQGEVVTDPRNAPEYHYSAFSAYGIATVYEDDFSNNQGWTGLGGQGEWTIGEATGGQGNDNYGGPDPSVDHTPTSDNRVLGNDLTSGSGGDYSANLNQTYWVTSPTIDCSEYIGVTFSFWRWLGVERNIYDRAFLQGYNGSSWITIFENGGGTIDESAWGEQSYDVSEMADGNPNFKVRFGIGETDVAWQYCGWNIDDLKVSGYSCEGGQVPDVAVEMIPDDPPIVVPPGGHFTYTGILTNNTDSPQTKDVWVMIDVPEYGWYGPVFRANNVSLAPNETLSYPNIRQNIPGFAPTGDYSYCSYCGDYPSVKEDSFCFGFTVAGGVSGTNDEWSLEGWTDGVVELPMETGLYNNYPNPFNAATNINYALANNAYVKLEIYNLMGQKIATLADENQIAGFKSVQWDATDLSSGVYFYKLSVDGDVFTKRMTLLK